MPAIVAGVDDAKLGRLMRLLRQRRGWRQIDLATKAGIGVSAVARLESGRLEPMRLATSGRLFRPSA